MERVNAMPEKGLPLDVQNCNIMEQTEEASVCGVIVQPVRFEKKSNLIRNQI